MKKTAVLVYDSFCNFEVSTALEILALAQKEITVFAATNLPVKSEDGLTIVPDMVLADLNVDEYDSLLLPGASHIREAIENPDIIKFIKKFSGKIIGAISIGPIMLVKAGLLNGKSFMAGTNKEDIIEEGFSEEELQGMIGWDDNLENPIEEGYIVTDKIITSISYNFVKWGLAFGKMVGIDVNPKTFGI